MAESNISWTRFTFNPWIGCTKVSAACDSCYAETWAAHYAPAVTWGKPGTKSKLIRTAPSTWAKPHAWNKQAQKEGIPARVFCASLADVFDNDADPAWRADLWEMIRATPWLDWLMLTKRPQNIGEMLPGEWGNGWPNVWLGTTAENQTEYDRRKKHLLAIPAVVHFFSVEPMLSAIDLGNDQYGDWYICGGESGPKRRPMNMGWVESLRDQCKARGNWFFFKQDTAFRPGVKGRASDELWACKEAPTGIVRTPVSVQPIKTIITDDLFSQ